MGGADDTLFRVADLAAKMDGDSAGLDVAVILVAAAGEQELPQNAGVLMMVARPLRDCSTDD